MKKFDTRVYSVSDFAEWHSKGQLELSPDFQRRSVWTQTGKSYLIDTLLRGKPIPKILITQDLKDRRSVRVVVDGQQRLRSILEYVDNAFPISRAHNKNHAGKRFEQLDENVQNELLKYEVGVDLIYDLPYKEILDIFARLNTYTVRLNSQELLNAKYVGYFKQLSYQIGFRYVDYWIDAAVITKAQATRMAEAELASDLLLALVDGVQTNKNVETLYARYDEEFAEIDKFESRFDRVMGIIGEIYPAGDLAETNWSRAPLFYSLFITVAHGLFNLSGLENVPRPTFRKSALASSRVSLDDISARYDRYTSANFKAADIPPRFTKFIDNARRRTADTKARVERASFICRVLGTEG